MIMPSEFRAAIEAAHGGPVEIVDGDRHYVLIRAEFYERLKDLFDDSPLSEQERAGLLRETGKRAGWDDPAMDAYNDLDPRRKS
jgi:hypothetical protein